MAGGAARILVWRGLKQLTHQPDSPEFNETADGRAYSYTYHGPYNVVMAAKPRRLATFKGLPAGFVVDKITVKKAPGGIGILTFTALPLAAAGFSNGDDSEPVYEVEWTEIQKKLEEHPRYKADGVMALDAQDRANIEAWRDEPDASLKGAFMWKQPDGQLRNLASSEATAAIDFAQKILNGTDSYVVYVPICRMTTKHTAKPQTGKCGLISSPPPAIKVEGYEYLKTADRLSRQSRSWTRVQEWTGPDKVDPDLYKEP